MHWEEAGKIVLQAESRSADSWMQLELSGTTEDNFSVRISFENATWQEHFIL